jgi:adenylate cyclase
MVEQGRGRVPDEAEFRRVLTGEHPDLTKMRRRFQRIPTSPRCKLCSAPFEGLGGAVLRHMGFARFSGNPTLCVNCIQQFRKAGTFGAEIPVTLLFADVRGSTGIGERLRPSEFRAYLDRFYRAGTDAILDHGGLVDKLVGDEVIGLFFGGITGPWHQAPAIDAAIDLLERVGRPDATPMGPIPVGAAVHTGEAYVGTTGPAGAVDDFTALGDVVNATARLASAAAAGEVLVSIAAATAAGRDVGDAERRTVDIRGRHDAIDVVVLGPHAGAAPAATA